MAKRWNHKKIASSYNVAEDVVRRIYATVQTAKRQGLYGGYYADLVERNVGRLLVGNEFEISRLAKKHLEYDPPSGYGGPKPTGAAKEPPRFRIDENKTRDASYMVDRAEREITDVLRRNKDRGLWGSSMSVEADRGLLRAAADDLCVAADRYEEAGAGVRSGTLRERARHARRGDYRLLTDYRVHSTKQTKQPRSAKTASLSIATFPTGFSYADRSRERGGDYVRLAFLPFDTLKLEWIAKRLSPETRAEIVAHANSIAAREGQDYPVSQSGQTVRLGGSQRSHSRKRKSTSPARLEREISAFLNQKR